MAAVSRSVAEVLTGPARGCRVLTAWAEVLHLVLDPAGGAVPEVLALLGQDAVRLPLGILLAPDERRVLAEVRVGDRGTVGAGALELGGTTVRPTRWWDPSLPRPVGLAATAQAETLAAALPPLPDEVTAPAAALAAALTSDVTSPLISPSSSGGASSVASRLSAPSPSPSPVISVPDVEHAAVREAVERLVGLGPGLTPAGDDVLVGALAARPHGELAGVVAAVLAADPARTTALSAALLDQALRGYGLPQLAALLRALDGPPGAALPRAAAALVGVGGSSGAAIGHGLVLGLRAAARTPERVA